MKGIQGRRWKLAKSYALA